LRYLNKSSEQKFPADVALSERGQDMSATDRIMKALRGKMPMSPSQEQAVRAEVQKYVEELLAKFPEKIVTR
jgi:hypothetical protein